MAKVVGHAAKHLPTPAQPERFNKYLLRLCRERRSEDAINLAYKAQGQLQHAGFNIVLRELLDQQRTKASWEFWNDMKRRRFQPNTSSYITLFNGLAKIFDNPEKVKSLSVKTMIQKIGNLYPAALEASQDDPVGHQAIVNTYLALLTNMNCGDLAIETVKALPQPHAYALTLLFRSVVRNPSPASIETAKGLWADFQERTPQLIDAQLVGGLYALLKSAGSESDSALADELAAKWFGFNDLESRPPVNIDGPALQGLMLQCYKRRDWQSALKAVQCTWKWNRDAVSERSASLLFGTLWKAGKSTSFDDMTPAIIPGKATEAELEALRVHLEEGKRHWIATRKSSNEKYGKKAAS